MLTASQNVTFTCRKCIHALKVSVVKHFLVLKISVVYQEKYIIGVIAWVICWLKDKHFRKGEQTGY